MQNVTIMCSKKKPLLSFVTYDSKGHTYRKQNTSFVKWEERLELDGTEIALTSLFMWSVFQSFK